MQAQRAIALLIRLNRHLHIRAPIPGSRGIFRSGPRLLHRRRRRRHLVILLQVPVATFRAPPLPCHNPQFRLYL
jgi:hypothetical protein